MVNENLLELPELVFSWYFMHLFFQMQFDFNDLGHLDDYTFRKVLINVFDLHVISTIL